MMTEKTRFCLYKMCYRFTISSKKEILLNKQCIWPKKLVVWNIMSCVTGFEVFIYTRWSLLFPSLFSPQSLVRLTSAIVACCAWAQFTWPDWKRWAQARLVELVHGARISVIAQHTQGQNSNTQKMFGLIMCLFLTLLINTNCSQWANSSFVPSVSPKWLKSQIFMTSFSGTEITVVQV